MQQQEQEIHETHISSTTSTPSHDGWILAEESSYNLPILKLWSDATQRDPTSNSGLLTKWLLGMHICNAKSRAQKSPVWYVFFISALLLRITECVPAP